MPKLPALTPQKIIQILERKGFVLERSKGSHRIYYHPETKRRAIVAFHRKDLPQGTLREPCEKSFGRLEYPMMNSESDGDS